MIIMRTICVLILLFNFRVIINACRHDYEIQTRTGIGFLIGVFGILISLPNRPIPGRICFAINISILCKIIFIGIFLYGLYGRIVAIKNSNHDRKKCIILDLMILIGLIGTILSFKLLCNRIIVYI